MARQLGAWINADGGSALPRPTIYSTGDHYNAVVNNDFYRPVLSKVGDSWYKFHPQPLKMTKGNTFDAIGTMPRDRWRDTIGQSLGAYNDNFSPIYTSADKVYAAVTGTTNDVVFYKKTAAGNYTAISTFTTVAPAPSINYRSFMSPNGEFFITNSPSSPFLAFFRRVGDTWSQLAAFTVPASGSEFLYSVGWLNEKSQAWYNNDTIVLHQTSSANFPANKNFYVYKYNTGTEIFEEQSVTGLYETLRWNANECSYTPDKQYLAISSTNIPYIRFYKTTNGLDFTDLSANVTGIPSFQHYGVSWDPSGTYMFTSINNASFVFGVYKREGDNLTRLTNCFSELPTSALATSRYSAAWSPDGRYVAIASGSSTSQPYLLWLYKRQGDYFERVGGSDIYSNASTDSDTGLATTLFASGTQFGFAWL